MYKIVEECPKPYVGLKWTECYSYYGKIIGEFKKSMSFAWQEEDKKWKEALNENYYLIEDTTAMTPYILTESQFIEKFSYNTKGGCWVQFELDENQVSVKV